MATKKAVSTGKKTTTRTTKTSAPVAKKTTTKVTKVKANSGTSSAASARALSARFSFSRAPLLAASVAEFIGVFMLAAVVLAVSAQQIYVLFASVSVVLAVGAVSGAHLNPLVTVGAWVTRRVTAARAVSYIVAQVLGGLLALVLLNSFIGMAPAPDAQAAQFGQQAPTLFSAESIPAGKEWVVLGAELLGSTIFAFAVAGAFRMVNDKLTAAFTYGGGLFVALLVAGTATSYVGGTAILNPALAATLQAVEFEVWPIVIYVVTPLVGGVIGFALHDLLRNESEPVVVA